MDVLPQFLKICQKGLPISNERRCHSAASAFGIWEQPFRALLLLNRRGQDSVNHV